MKKVLFALFALVIAFPLAAQDIPMKEWTPPLHWMAPLAKKHPTRDILSVGDRKTLGPLPVPLSLVAIPPCRQYDSRTTSKLLQNTPRTVVLSGSPCGIPETAQAVAVNITAFNIDAPHGLLEPDPPYRPVSGVFWVGASIPLETAWINYPLEETQRGNAGIVALSIYDEIIVQINQVSGTVDFTVDVFGYYAPFDNGTCCPLCCNVCSVVASDAPFGEGVSTNCPAQCKPVIDTSTGPVVVTYVYDGNALTKSLRRGATFSFTVDIGSTYCVLKLPAAQD